MSALVETRIERRPIKKPRACSHCHVRKVRCDAWQVGLPCTRCRRRNQTRSCVLITAFPVSGTLRNWEHRGAPSSDSGPAEQQEGQDCIPVGCVREETMSANDAVLDEITCGTSAHDEPGADQPNASTSQCQGRVSEPVAGKADERTPEAISTRHVESNAAEAISTDVGDAGVRDEDVHVRVAEAMSRGTTTVVSPTETGGSDECYEVIEFHEGITPVTIVGGALGRRVPNRLTCVKLRGAADPNIGMPWGTAGVDTGDAEYLERKGALGLPPQSTCIRLFRLYFAGVYPYAPILDPIQFMKAFFDGSQSYFLMQSIFANVVPHAPLELLNSMGYQTRMAAQQEFYSRATLLYDLGQEKSQLSRLQGSIMLSSLSFSYAVDKDYRYWFSNACRIATQMGLHRQYIFERLDRRSTKLFRRIWWTLYNRDVLMAVSGLSNLRKFDDRFCDVAVLKEDDWADNEIPQELRLVLCPSTRLHKTYLIENCKLSLISSTFLDYFTTPGKTPSLAQVKRIEDEIIDWKQKLDPIISIGTLHEWTVDNIWVLVLLAMSYRLEAVFYRALQEYLGLSGDHASVARVSQKQENAMFELSSIIQRASLHEVIGLCPLSFMTCASTILAMRIEIALHPGTSFKKKFATRVQIFAELEYLREACQHWTSLTWTLRLFEVAILRMGLSIEGGSSIAPEASGGRAGTTLNSHQDQLATFPHIEDDVDLSAYFDLVNGTNSPGALNGPDDFFGVLPVTGNYDWIEDLIAPHHLE